MTSIDLFLAIKRSLEPVQLGNCNVYIIYKLTMRRLIINFNLMRAKLDRLVAIKSLILLVNPVRERPGFKQATFQFGGIGSTTVPRSWRSRNVL